MLKAFNTFRKSLKVWHVAPLFLPLLLGSTNIRISPAASSLQGAVPSIPTSVLIDRELAKFRQTQPLPSQVLSTFSARPLPHKNQQVAAVHQMQPKARAASQSSSSTATTTSTASAQASLASLATPKPAQNLPPIPLRVAIALKAKTLTIATSDNGAIANQNGQVLGQLTAQTGRCRHAAV